MRGHGGFKRLLQSGKTPGEEGRRFCPILPRTQLPNKSFRTLPGGLQEGFLYNPDTSSSTFYVTNQFKATSPQGNLKNTTETLLTKVAWNVFLFQPVLQVAGKRKLKKGALQGAVLKLGLARACYCPSWTQSLGALPCPPSALLRAASHHHIMALHLRLLVRQLVVLHFEAVRAGGDSQAWRLHGILRDPDHLPGTLKYPHYPASSGQ